MRKSPREKIQDALCDLGLAVSVDDFWTQHAAYRGKHWDCACWGAYVCVASDRRKQVSLHCFQTMTECARRGIELDTIVDDQMPYHSDVEVFAKDARAEKQ